MDPSLNRYEVKFIRTSEINPDGSPILQTFLCWAEDEDHAEEQMFDAYPDAGFIAASMIAFVTRKDNPEPFRRKSSTKPTT